MKISNELISKISNEVSKVRYCLNLGGKTTLVFSEVLSEKQIKTLNSIVDVENKRNIQTLSINYSEVDISDKKHEIKESDFLITKEKPIKTYKLKEL